MLYAVATKQAEKDEFIWNGGKTLLIFALSKGTNLIPNDKREKIIK
jgi:hypothetical protein